MHEQDIPSPEGIEPGPLARWFRDNLDEVEPPLRFHIISGGRSNLTYDVHDAAGHRYVLRRPPLHGVLPSAHDVAREHRAMAALASTDIPVPTVRGYCSAEEVTGAPFFVMDHVVGRVIRDADGSASLLPATRRRASESLVDVLAALHQVDPAAVGLEDLGRTEGYIPRQLRRWRLQYEQSGGTELTLVDELHRMLADRVPTQRRAGIVHGDYRLDNLMIGDNGEVQAVLDWELCTLGDPLADLGLLLVYWTEVGDETIPTLSSPTDQPGYLDRAALVARYAEATGAELEDIAFYQAFGFWKLAVILDGVHRRYRSGAYVEADDAFRLLGESVPRLLERSRETIIETSIASTNS